VSNHPDEKLQSVSISECRTLLDLIQKNTIMNDN